MTDYHYSFWRRGVFAGLLIIVLALALIPPLTKGTMNLRVFTISTPAPILHFYITINQMELHTAGLPSSIGWVTITWTDNPPKLDLAGQNGQSSPGASIISPIQSGRYDQIRISIQQSSLIYNSAGESASCLITRLRVSPRYPAFPRLERGPSVHPLTPILTVNLKSSSSTGAISCV